MSPETEVRSLERDARAVKADIWRPFAELCSTTPCPHCGQYTLVPVHLWPDSDWIAYCLTCHDRIARLVRKAARSRLERKAAR